MTHGEENTTEGATGVQVNDEGWTMYGARTAKEMFQEFTEHLHCTTQDDDEEPPLPAAKLASWETQGNVVEVALVCDACHVIIGGLTFENPDVDMPGRDK